MATDRTRRDRTAALAAALAAILGVPAQGPGGPGYPEEMACVYTDRIMFRVYPDSVECALALGADGAVALAQWLAERYA